MGSIRGQRPNRGRGVHRARGGDPRRSDRGGVDPYRRPAKERDLRDTGRARSSAVQHESFHAKNTVLTTDTRGPALTRTARRRRRRRHAGPADRSSRSACIARLALIRAPLRPTRVSDADAAAPGQLRSVGISCLQTPEPSAGRSAVLLLLGALPTPRLLLAAGLPRRAEQLPAPRAGPRERGTNSSEEQLDRQRTEQAADAQADRLRPSEVRHKLDARAVRPSGDRAIQQPSTLRDAVGPLKLDVDHRGGCRSRWELTQDATATFLVNNGMPLEEVKQLVCRTTVAPT